MNIRNKAERALRAKYNLKGARLNFNPIYAPGFKSLAVFEAWFTADVRRGCATEDRTFSLTAEELARL